MIRQLKPFRNSLFTQVLAVALSALFGLLVVMLVLLQTIIAFRLSPFAITDVAVPVSEMVLLAESVPEETKPQALAAFGGATRSARLNAEFPENAEHHPKYLERLLERSEKVADILAYRDIRFRYLSAYRLTGNDFDEDGVSNAFAALEISVALDDGRVLSMAFSAASLISSRPRSYLVVLLLTVVSIAAVMALLIGQAVKPLREVEAAAQRFGASIDPEPAPESGAEEVRRVARALNAMQQRVKVLMAERARMVSAVAHDIRTGLTRLRLRLDEADSLDVAAMTRDLNQMETLVEDMTIYARSKQPAAQQELIELWSFMRSYAEDAPGGMKIDRAESEEDFLVAADSLALTRALNNLVDNARRYGGGGKVSCHVTDKGFEIRIDDSGRGIPEEQLESVFEPFFRLEGSRSRDTGGSGLGLGIARALIRAQGGDILLSNRQSGGLRASIVFPSSHRVQ